MEKIYEKQEYIILYKNRSKVNKASCSLPLRLMSVCSAALSSLFSSGVICLLQTPGGGHPDGAEPSGELWTYRGAADQTSDPHHSPLC